MRQIACFCVFLVLLWTTRSNASNNEASAQARLPSLIPEPPYVSSAACQSCHPKEHATWLRSYHRTMTQVVRPDTVAGKFDGTVVQANSLSYRVFRERDEFKAEMPDPDVMMYVVQGGKKLLWSQIPRVQAPVVMATGSHHYQTYWVASPRYPGLLQTLPLVYLIADQRWVPRDAAFMHDPADQTPIVTQWNHHCIRCHSTAGNPGLDDTTGMLKTRVAELGIACEACHGPGKEHVDKQRLLQAQSFGLTGTDRTIVNPANLDHRRSSQVCGQCHGVFVIKNEYGMRYAHEGNLFRPGEDLYVTRYYMQHPNSNPSPSSMTDLKRNPTFYRESWWDDGTILGGGREYSAFLASACFNKGEISCLSCHSLHRSDPVNQLRSGGDGVEACTQCHQQPKYTTEVTTHTRHKAASEGSNCLNCHMPYTSYALFKAIRSHQIASPNVQASARFGTPNACNLCHLDKTLDWTQKHLNDRYGKPLLALTDEQRNLSAGVLWMWKGNAAQRVIAAWHAGWKPALETSGTQWPVPGLATLLQDPYGVVRYVAARSLRSLSGFERFEFDFLAPEAILKSKATSVMTTWRLQLPTSRPFGGEVLLDENGHFLESQAQELLSGRDNRVVTIKE